jgi:hypothetical protein
MTFPSQINVSLPVGDDGYLGRECPIASCEGYFKIKPGTGLKGTNLPCHCPYCGHIGAQNDFTTKDQIEFAESVAFQQVVDVLRGELKKMEFDIKPKGPFGIGISMKLEPGAPIPLRQYRERTLETHISCGDCALDYSVYGIFAYCPDCGNHNSFQILEKNIDLVRKQLSLAATQLDPDMRRHLTEDALENCISAFDGFARETCRVRAPRSRDPSKCTNVSFQNLRYAADKVSGLFGVDIRDGVSGTDWDFAHTGFMRRHVVAHRGGVIDDRYLVETGEPASLRGRRLVIEAADVERLAIIIMALGRFLIQQLPR